MDGGRRIILLLVNGLRSVSTIVLIIIESIFINTLAIIIIYIIILFN